VASKWDSAKRLWQTESSCGGIAPLKTVTLLAIAAVLAIAACKAPTTTVTNSTITTANPTPAPAAATPAPATTPATATSTANRIIYPDPSQAKADLSAALRTAAQTHKRVLLDFGGNWCGDCQVLDIYFHNPRNLPVLESNFVLVHINVGHFDINQDVASHYRVPLDKGVPAVAVLSDQGKLLYSQRGGEFAPMRRMDPSAVTSFLAQWRPAKAGCSAVMVNC
jgi:thioredoxin 1